MQYVGTYEFGHFSILILAHERCISQNFFSFFGTNPSLIRMDRRSLSRPAFEGFFRFHKVSPPVLRGGFLRW